VLKKALDRTCVQWKETGRRLTVSHKVFTHFEASAWVDQRLDIIIPRKLDEYWSVIQVGVEDEIMSGLPSAMVLTATNDPAPFANRNPQAWTSVHVANCVADHAFRNKL
jgi:hypothetical protein